MNDPRDPDPNAGPPRRRRRAPDAITILPTIQLQRGMVLLDRYEIVELLGEGGMGQVWLANDRRLRLRRALKFLSRAMANDPRCMRLMEREAQTAARLKHPGIAGLVSLEHLDDNLGAFVVMEYVPGWPQPDGTTHATLEKWLFASQRLTEPQTRAVLAGVLDALAYAHDYRDDVVTGGIVHRDIKPANILLDAAGRPLVADFGIARAISSALSRLTGTEGSGTELYMSPEQSLGEELDGRADIYSVGIMAFELLTGDVPFFEGNIARQHELKPVPPIPEASPDINAWIARATAKKPADRWPTAKDAARALEGAVGEVKPETPTAAAPTLSAMSATCTEAKQRSELVAEAEQEFLEILALDGECEQKDEWLLHDITKIWKDYLAKFKHIEHRFPEVQSRIKELEAERHGHENAQRQAAAEQAHRRDQQTARMGWGALASGLVGLTILAAVVFIIAANSNSSPSPTRSSQTVAAAPRLPQRAPEPIPSPAPTPRPAATQTPRPQPTASPRPAPTQAATPALSSPGTTAGERRVLQLAPGVEMAFRWIPAGSFMMGSPASEEGRYDDETPHRVTLTRGFWMAETETTQAQWRAVMGTDPSKFKGATLPVETVSWDDATEFCRKVSSSSGLRVSLPTEAQWEYACRAGTTTPFHFGATISTDQANSDGSFAYGSGRKGVNRGKTTPVGSFPANAWGLQDMHGNVAEWCADWFGEYPSQGATDPTGPSTTTYANMRGGGWHDGWFYSRSAKRFCGPPDTRAPFLGFRVVALTD